MTPVTSVCSMKLKDGSKCIWGWLCTLWMVSAAIEAKSSQPTVYLNRKLLYDEVTRCWQRGCLSVAAGAGICGSEHGGIVSMLYQLWIGTFELVSVAPRIVRQC